MESQKTLNAELENLSPCGSGKRSTSSHSSSPEFEFWMVRNPPFPEPDLISADELFVNGVLRPLHLLPNKQPEENPQIDSNQPASQPPIPDPDPIITSDPVPVLSASKRPSQSGASGAELNINIWPFPRSRSAGTRPRMTSRSTDTRKVSSAPCSRSNSAGESKSRKWPSSPGRARVHLGRSSPVWQVRRGCSPAKTVDVTGRSAEKSSARKEVAETCGGKIGTNGNNANKAKALNLHVPMCIGYRHHLNCRTDENSAMLAGSSTGSDDGGKVRSSDANVGSGS
ncbi:hypothetical protein GOBAR_DD06566 [Gossypium barbadense]|nr:hypothetical protein GOBAR_DD06566 [Gossypium barbadense]